MTRNPHDVLLDNHIMKAMREGVSIANPNYANPVDWNGKIGPQGMKIMDDPLNKSHIHSVLRTCFVTYKDGTVTPIGNIKHHTMDDNLGHVTLLKLTLDDMSVRYINMAEVRDVNFVAEAH